jgi:hypothetical protein
MLIYLDEYRKARARCPAVRDRHGEGGDYVNAGAIASVSAMFCFQHPYKLSPELPEDPTSVDLDKVLDRIHALATQF